MSIYVKNIRFIFHCSFQMLSLLEKLGASRYTSLDSFLRVLREKFLEIPRAFLVKVEYLSLLLPTTLSNGGGGGKRGGRSVDPPTNSCLYSNNFKLGRVLGLSFLVSKMVELMKSLSHGNHDNHSIPSAFLPFLVKM